MLGRSLAVALLSVPGAAADVVAASAAGARAASAVGGTGAGALEVAMSDGGLGAGAVMPSLAPPTSAASCASNHRVDSILARWHSRDAHAGAAGAEEETVAGRQTVGLILRWLKATRHLKDVENADDACNDVAT